MSPDRPDWKNFSSSFGTHILIDGHEYTKEEVAASGELQDRVNRLFNARNHGIEVGYRGKDINSAEVQEHLKRIADPALQLEFTEGVEFGYRDYLAEALLDE